MNRQAYKKPIAIAAAYLEEGRGMGYQGGLPWKRIREDMVFFQHKTQEVGVEGKMNAVVMGRGTWESLPAPPSAEALRSLSGRLNIVVSRTLSETYRNGVPEVVFVPNLDTALRYCDKQDHIERVWIIGGSSLYDEAMSLPECQDLWLTELTGLSEEEGGKADVFFPEVPKNYSECKEDRIEQPSENGSWNLRFKHLRNQFNPWSPERDYLRLMDYILKNGEDLPNDRTGVGILQVFAGGPADPDLKALLPLSFPVDVVNEAEAGGDVQKFKYRIPAVTTKPLYFRGAVWELIWFLNGFTDANWLRDRNVHIWDGNGTREFLDSRGLTDYPEGELGPVYGKQWVNWDGINQIAEIIRLCREEPWSRRMLLSGWNVRDLPKMALPPCHDSYSFMVTDQEKPMKTLNLLVRIRSNDMFLGNPFNVASAAVLLILISRCAGMRTGRVGFAITNAHLYYNQLEEVKKQIQRCPYHYPVLELKKPVREYEDMKGLEYKDFKLHDYKRWPALAKVEMAA